MTPELFATRRPVAPVGLASMKAKPVTPDAFITAPKPDHNETPVIGVRPGKIITYREVGEPGARRQRASSPTSTPTSSRSPSIERHGKNGNIGRGFVTGFGLKRAPSPPRSAMTATTSPSSAPTTPTWRWRSTG